MQTSITFVLSALITVSSGTIQQNTFIKTKNLVGMEFPDVPVVPGVRSRLQCAALCDQHPWCFAISWNQNKKTCQELTRVLIPQTMPSGIYTVSTEEEDGYTNMAGMLVKFFGIALPWQEAHDYCVNKRSRLVVLDTLEKSEVMSTSLNIKEYSTWWVGATKVDGTWTWTTGQQVEWNVMEDGDGNCVELHYGKLYDFICAVERPIICER